METRLPERLTPTSTPPPLPSHLPSIPLCPPPPGQGEQGQIGDGNIYPISLANTYTIPPAKKVDTSALGGSFAGWSQISIAGNHACALAAGTGAAYCWGGNTDAVLGGGSIGVSTARPQKVNAGNVPGQAFASIKTAAWHT